LPQQRRARHLQIIDPVEQTAAGFDEHALLQASQRFAPKDTVCKDILRQPLRHGMPLPEKNLFFWHLLPPKILSYKKTKITE
jgi:hypothetical protein